MRSLAIPAGRAAAACLVIALACAPEASAQQAAGRNAGNISLTGGFDFLNAYMFRGLLQDDSRLIMWPYVDAAIAFNPDAAGDSAVTLHVGTWNSLHTGRTGTAGPSGKLWYESDFYTTLDVAFDPGFVVSTTFTAYTSPNNSFSTVKEIAVKVAADDPGLGVGLNPYALVAFEFDTAPGLGQADGGFRRGTYLELGIAPGWDADPVSLALPIKLGLSLDDYYELGGVDHRFGFLSLAAIATLPIGRTTSYGTWDVHGGVEFQSLGDTPEAFNRGDQTKVIGFVGVGFSY